MPSIVLCFRFFFVHCVHCFTSVHWINLVIVQFLSGKMKKHQALRDPSPAFLSTLTCLYILNTLYMSLSQLGSTRELSTRENDLSSCFLILPIDSSGHKGLILLQNPSGEGLFHWTGLNSDSLNPLQVQTGNRTEPVQFFFTSRLCEGCALCQEYFLSPSLSLDNFCLSLRFQLKCYFLQETFPVPHLANLGHVSL